jgi:hypothetical protein
MAPRTEHSTVKTTSVGDLDELPEEGEVHRADRHHVRTVVRGAPQELARDVGQYLSSSCLPCS